MPPQLITRVTSTEAEKELTWWNHYSGAASAAGLSLTALRVVGLDAEYILTKGVQGAGPPGSDPWPSTRVRKGLVIGSVQSGKTASMLAVGAKCLDAGVDAVVMLTGTRVALWRQTLDRTIQQLDGWTVANEREREKRRVFIPSPRLVHGSRGTPPLEDLYQANPGRVRRILSQRKPVVALSMKHSDHLMRLGQNLRRALERSLREVERPLHVVVIDDEADDGSILDAVVESALEAESSRLKQLPRHITGLWTATAGVAETFHEGVFVTYVAYTATPQANILQSDHNPLSPTDFVVALRTPSNEGSVEPPRESTFCEPLGPKSYYSGGEVFYRTLADLKHGLCEVLPEVERDDFDSDADYAAAAGAQYVEHLGHGLRSFFVATAMRLFHDGRSASEAKALSPAPRSEIAGKSPPNCSMLVNPAATVARQLEVARIIAAWSGEQDLVFPDPESYPTDDEGRAVLDASGLEARLKAEESRWKAWFDAFESSRQQLTKLGATTNAAPNRDGDWGAVKELLINDVFPNTRLAVVNSDPLADDRPVFGPVATPDGDYVASPDLISIFVSGNVMARGITLEGLTTTLFLRDVNTPSADTQMQMQRWFGYRGKHLYWCRVFLYEDQLDLFRSYHENDEALKGEVLEEMNREDEAVPLPLVLQGPRFRATGKIANLGALPLCPGRQPFVRVIERGEHREHNLGVLANLLDAGTWPQLVAGGTPRGIIRDQPMTMLEVATLLEQLRYSGHDPDPRGRNHDRWRAVAVSLGLVGPTEPLFRPPGHLESRRDVVAPPQCPYTIAAYLRLWQAALSRRARGLFPTDDYRTPWSMINLAAYAKTAPDFWVGVRYGGKEAGAASDPRFVTHSIRRVIRAHDGSVLTATWGSRNPGEGPESYLGDHLFDYHHHGRTPPIGADEAVWRPRGEPGLLLFHVIDTDDGETIAPALALPIGGPDHFAAMAPRLRQRSAV